MTYSLAEEKADNIAFKKRFDVYKRQSRLIGVLDISGLACHAAVRWLLGCEPDVRAAVLTFAEDRGSHIIEVAGPPDRAEMLRARRFGQPVPLPCVRLYCRMVRHNLSGELGVEVTCSDAGLAEIALWMRKARDGKLRSLREAPRLDNLHA
jgi:hypothetical protein